MGFLDLFKRVIYRYCVVYDPIRHLYLTDKNTWSKHYMDAKKFTSRQGVDDHHFRASTYLYTNKIFGEFLFQEGAEIKQ